MGIFITEFQSGDGKTVYNVAKGFPTATSTHIKKYRQEANKTVLSSAVTVQDDSRFLVLMPSPLLEDPFREGNHMTQEREAQWYGDVKAYLSVTDDAIPMKHLRYLACEQHVDEFGFLLPQYVWLSWKYCSRSPGYISKQLLIATSNLASADDVAASSDMIELFGNCSNVRKRTIIAIDDICYGRPCHLFQNGQCNYCKAYRSHHTPVCPLYPSEADRVGILKDDGKCSGCGKPCCPINLFADHSALADFVCCYYCGPDTGKTHVKWRCNAPKREEQNYDVATRYLISNWATRSWKDEQWVQLLQNICDEWDLPFPDCITNEALPRIQSFHL